MQIKFAMVCDGPDPPEHPQEISARPRHDLQEPSLAEDSDDDQREHFGYEPLPQAPDTTLSDHSEDESAETRPPNNDIPTIEPMEAVLTREVWNLPHDEDPIKMDNERAQQVMTAMANFALPQASIPEWAQSISEEQWKQTLSDRIEKMKGNR